MTPDVIAELNKKDGEPSEFHKAILTHALGLVKMSRSKMSKYYDDWDLQDEVYRGERYLDRDDVDQATKGKPVKMVVPNTFAQVMTFSSFLFLMFNQNRTFFELLPTGNEDFGGKAQDMSMILDRDLRKNSWNILLFQHLLDVGRFGPSVLECCWTRQVTRAFVPQEPVVGNYNGVETTTRPGSAWQDFTKYEGNLIRNVSPYRFFPDTRHPLVDFQKGEFCAAEEEYSMSQLYELQRVGEVAGIDNIKPLPQNLENLRGGVTRTSIDIDRSSRWLYGDVKSKGVALVTKMQVKLVPANFKFGPKDQKLGPEEFPILYHLWYANDNQVIRCEPAYWWHNEFGWSVSQFTPDMHATLNLGLADLVYRLQDVISWHINARITDVRRNMRGRLIVDPAGVETSSLDGDGDIYLRKSASKSGVDRWLKPLNMADVTQGHMVDAELLGKLMQVVTGVNDNLMGQYNSGRRSAQEARTVLGGAAGRMKLHGHLIWESGLGKMGKQMLSNSRQNLPLPEFVKAVGHEDADPPQYGPNGEMVPGLTGEQKEAMRYVKFKGTPEEVIGGEDYFVFDSTLASEKGFQAQSLQELLVAIVSSDALAAARMTQGIDPVKLVEEIQYLRGAGNIKRFKYSPEEQEQIRQQQIAMEAAKNQPKPPTPPSQTMNYKDAPPPIRRQMEQAEGYKPATGPEMEEIVAKAKPSTNGAKP